MARGWESKSIESQQEEAARGKTRRPLLTEQQRADALKRRTLELSRTRAANDLDKATAPHHRRLLEHTLAAIDEQLAQLDRASS